MTEPKRLSPRLVKPGKRAAPAREALAPRPPSAAPGNAPRGSSAVAPMPCCAWATPRHACNGGKFLDWGGRTNHETPTCAGRFHADRADDHRGDRRSFVCLGLSLLQGAGDQIPARGRQDHPGQCAAMDGAGEVIKYGGGDGKTILVSAQQWMERFYTENFRYDKNRAGVRADDPTQFSARFSVSPTEGSALYDIAVVVEDGESDKYSVTATPRAGSAMARDRCGNFCIDHSGQKTVFSHGFGSANDAMANRVCWQ